MRRKSLQQGWLIACLLRVDRVQEVGHLTLQGRVAGDPARQSALLLLFQGNAESPVLEKREKYFYPKLKKCY